MNSEGEVICLQEQSVLNLEKYLRFSQTLIIVVSNEEQPDRFIEDEEFPEISGATSIKKVAKIEIYKDSAPANTVELCRIYIREGNEQLKMLDEDQMWQTSSEILKNLSSYDALIDTRYRNEVSGLSYSFSGVFLNHKCFSSSSDMIFIHCISYRLRN